MITIIKEIYARRNLIAQLVIKDLKIRYSRPLLGFLWAFLLPLSTTFIYYVVFTIFLKAKITEAPFIIYLMSAVFPWHFFHNSIVCSTTSLIDNKNLIRESKFPYYFLPVSIVLSNLINFLPSLAILVITSSFVLKGLPLLIFFLPIVLLIQLLFTLGLSIIFSILYVKYRDIKYVVEILLAILFNLSPVFYSIALVKSSLSAFLFKAYIYNPLTGILIFYRSIILKGFFGFIENYCGFISIAIIPAFFSLVVLFLGFYLYEKKKNNLNDYLPY